MERILTRIFSFAALVLCFLAFAPDADAQFKEKAFKQNYNDPADTTQKDSADVVFTFKEYFGGLSHKREAKLGVMFAGSTVFVGGQQIYNRQYWKLPIVYGGLAATAGCGIYYRSKWKNTGDKHYQHVSNWCFAGTGLVYWATLLDGIANYNRDEYPQPTKATLYSALLPGLGQAYNGEYWKIPIYYSGLLGSAYFLASNNSNYLRYKRIHNEASTNADYDGPITADRALYYRNIYRRYRDYSIVALLGFYLLQVIDANVFAYMQDFELSDNIAMNIGPAVMTDEVHSLTTNQYNYALHSSSPMIPSAGINGVGIRLGFTF